MSTLTLKARNYDAARKWSDGYTAELNQIAATILYESPKLLSVYFKTPSLADDRKLGIDMWIETDRMKVSYRVRESKYRRYALEGFTIRTSSLGGKSELDKLQNPDFSDFMLYAIADAKVYGRVDCAAMIDMKVLAASLAANPSLIENAEKGSNFIDLKYDDLPLEVVCGLYNLKRKGDDM